MRAVLAQTAMSTVYEGWDERIGRRVAVKVISIIDGNDFEGQELLARFARGAKAAGQLNHPNIVQVYDYAEQDDVVYLVMEFIEGHTLKQKLDSEGAMDPARIVAILGQVLLGLGYSHARGVVHRDMKPANILLTAKGEAKITDFGIARMERSDLTQPGMFIGTPSYMSPEQFRGDPIDFRTDIYSVGVILYQMLTARRPYEGGLATIMHKVLTVEPPLPSSFGGMALAGFDPVVRRAMAKRPADRFGSAADFARAIEAAADATAVRVTSVAGRPVPAAPRVQRAAPIRPAATPRTAPRVKRVPPWQLYAVTGGLFAAAAVIGLARLQSQHRATIAPPMMVATLPERPSDAAAPAATATQAPADQAALPALPIRPVKPPVLPALPLEHEPASSPRPLEHTARATAHAQTAERTKPEAQSADADTLRRVLARLSHQLSAAPDEHAAAPSVPDDHAAPNATPHDQNTVDEASLSVLWYAASSSAIGLLFQGNGPGSGPAQPRGLSVIGVLAGSPAERAGCRAGDLILAVNDRPVTDPAVFDQLRTAQFHGRLAKLKVMRGGKIKILPIATQSASVQ